MKKQSAEAFIHRMSDFGRLGITPDRIEEWEDGMRTDGWGKSYEWWYFDAKLTDHTTLVIVFYTKNLLQLHSSVKPMITITLTDETGATLFDHTIMAEAADFNASKDHCEVRIGNNIFRGDLKNYLIQIDSPEVKANINLSGTVPSYRAGTGHAYFKKGSKEAYFAWLNAIPQGIVSGTLTIHGREKSLTGSGYHDHNWGDIPLPEILHHWYWGRGEVGDYTVITSYMTATKTYGYTHGGTFLLTHKDQILAYDPYKMKVSFEDIYTDKNTGKPVANKIIYLYEEENHRYIITYQRERDISNTPFIEKLNGISRLLAKLIRFDGSYLRFAGQVTLEIYEKGQLVETITDSSAVWELMYFGHAMAHD